MPERDPEPAPLLSKEARAEAWRRHNRESILRGLELTPAERFRWLEEAQAAFARLQATRGEDDT
ncbi:MAG: hypothetical protein ACYTGX_16395 [Planctomycetota bacterium]|jgi:hypothetical protein